MNMSKQSEIAMDATGLTQLSSREQLSALMDGALPADETRFLLRRLQHDASLAECWERWRLSAEVMRGLAPAQRLPADFASRVAASLRAEQANGEALHVQESAKAGAAGTRATGSSTWLRWGGGAAVAASLAVVALMSKPAVVGSPGNVAEKTAVAVADRLPSRATSTIALSRAAERKTPLPEIPAPGPAGMDLESRTAALASVVVAVARPARNPRRGNPPPATRAASMQDSSMLASTSGVQRLDAGIAAASNIMPLLPQTDIITRPWPRSVLPHTGNAGITVGFGDTSRSTATHNPFQPPTGIGSMMPPALAVDPPASDAATPANDETVPAASHEPQP